MSICVAEEWLKSPVAEAHPRDERMVIINAATQIPTFGSDDFKGGIWSGALPVGIMDELNRLSDRALESIRSRIMRIDPGSGTIDFTREMRSELSSHALGFIEDVSSQFNKVGLWPATFLMQRDLGLHQIAKGWHLDSKSACVPRQLRAFINISSHPEDQDHETEWMPVAGLRDCDLKTLKNEYSTTPLDDLPTLFRERAEVLRSGDMFMTKGMGDYIYNSISHSGPLHRAPLHKNAFPEQGKRRVGLIWQRDVDADINWDPA